MFNLFWYRSSAPPKTAPVASTIQQGTRTMEPDLVKQLRLWSSLKPGDHAPVNNWGPALMKLLNEAADALERSGAYYVIATSPTVQFGHSTPPCQLGPFETIKLAMDAANVLTSSGVQSGIIWHPQIIGGKPLNAGF